MRAGSFGPAVLAAAAAAIWSASAATAAAQQPPAPPPIPAPSPTPAVSAPEVPAPSLPPPGAQAPPAPEPSGGERIIGIRVVGYQTVAPDTIAHYLGIKVGDPYDPEKLRQNFPSLWEAGLLENAKIEAERSPEGVTLVVTIEERPLVKDVDFAGNKKLSTSQIKDALKDGKAEVKAGAPLSLRDVAHARSVISDFYTAQGFRSATIDYRIDDISKTEKKVVFLIDEGDKVKIESIEFTGNTAISAQALRNAMKKTKVATWWRFLSDDTVYSQANYEADVESIKAAYQAKGYKDVVVKDPILDVYVVNPKAKPEKTKRRVRITIPIVQGDKFYTNDITITRVLPSGQPADPPEVTVFPTHVLLKEFKDLPPGSVLDRDKLVAGLATIETMYKTRGFIYWFADPVYKEVGSNKVDVDIHMFEGEKFYLGRLEVQGNTLTRDKVVRREFGLDEGDVMDMEAVKKSIQKISQLGYFKLGEEPQFSVRPDEHKVDLVLKGQETSRNEIQFGAGYSGYDGFFGQFSFQTRNFLGRGEVLGLSAQVGKVSKFYDLSYTVPWFMDKNQSVGASIFSRNVIYSTVQQTSRGATLFYAKGIGLFDSVSGLYSYEDVHANYPVAQAPIPPGQPAPAQKFVATSGSISSLTPAYRYDSRNDPINPTRGFRLTAAVQIAPDIFGGTNSFIKPTLGSTIYIPVPLPKNAVLALNGEIGYLLAVGNPAPSPSITNGLPIFQRFQLGGEQSMRGYAQGAVVPLQPVTHMVFTDSQGAILGGNKYFVINVEYQFLNVGPATLLAFGDFGNNYFDTQSISFSNIRTAFGMELRVFLPIFQAPLRFIYAINPNPIQPIDQYGFPLPSLQEKKSGFTFSIGRSF
ncbi:MAG TPA: outer membrane protein assembly factor BamA [Thermoanaerobaculia bacterium]|nr:outer membrane protein assembly factor BamA [Thermoanaerobaculia bacterium]